MNAIEARDIYFDEMTKARSLVASPQLDDPNFVKKVYQHYYSYMDEILECKLRYIDNLAR